jgi:hypothetical protein
VTNAEQNRSGINQPGRNLSGEGKIGKGQEHYGVGEDRINFLKLPA